MSYEEDKAELLPITLFAFYICHQRVMISPQFFHICDEGIMIFFPFSLFASYICDERITNFARMVQNWFVAWLDYLSKGNEREGLLISILYFFNQQQCGKGRHRCLTAILGRVSRTHKAILVVQVTLLA